MEGEGKTACDDFGTRIYHFDEVDFGGPIYDLTIMDTGDIYLVSCRGGIRQVVRSNGYGGYMEDLPLVGLPAQYAAFTPGGIFSHNNLLYVVDRESLNVVVCQSSGLVLRIIDLRSLLRLPYEGSDFIQGFGGDTRGNLLFTLPSKAQAFRLRPDGELQVFGKKGSGQGLFESVGSIGADSDAFIYVTDPCRNKVLVFSPELSFVTEFGSRGFGINYFVGQMQVTKDDKGRFYVSHNQARTISVFQTNPEDIGKNPMRSRLSPEGIS